ncbi:MAG TPA: hypothetical protein VG248_03030 [Caulobacteraceae bacterium]|jgi:hypothetical protein|nr:hypothetical protein [Caulobacteraceae bacterium]
MAAPHRSSSRSGRIALRRLGLAKATFLTADQIHTQIARINASIGGDPALAIGTSKELVETTCKTILANLGEEAGSLDLGDRVKAASKQLKLLPDDVPNAAKGAEALHVLDGLLYHGADLNAAVHHIDGGGVSDHANYRDLM